MKTDQYCKGEKIFVNHIYVLYVYVYIYEYIKNFKRATIRKQITQLKNEQKI